MFLPDTSGQCPSTRLAQVVGEELVKSVDGPFPADAVAAYVIRLTPQAALHLLTNDTIFPLNLVRDGDALRDAGLRFGTLGPLEVELIIDPAAVGAQRQDDVGVEVIGVASW